MSDLLRYEDAKSLADKLGVNVIGAQRGAFDDNDGLITICVGIDRKSKSLEMHQKAHDAVQEMFGSNSKYVVDISKEAFIPKRDIVYNREV